MPASVALMQALPAVQASPGLLTGWAGEPRWGLILGLSLLAGLAAALAGYALVRGRGRTLMVLGVGAAFLTGGAAGFLGVVNQEFALEYPDRPCASGPWTERWEGSPAVYRALPNAGNVGAFEVTRILPPGNGTLGPWGGPKAWTDARVAGMAWDPPPNRTRGEHTELFLASAIPDPGIEVLVQVHTSDEEAIARDLLRWGLENATGAQEQTVDAWVENMPADQDPDARVVVRWVIDNATFDPSAFQHGEEGAWTPVSPSYHHVWEDQKRATQTSGHPYPPLRQMIQAYQAGDWNMRVLPGVKLAEGELNRTYVMFQVTGFGETTLQVEEYLPRERWDALASDVYRELGLGEAPDRDWAPGPAAVC